MEHAAERRAIRLIIRGRVQGVGYRWWAVGQARRRGLDGWVRNRRDGSVELLAIGAEAGLEALTAACRHGPPAAFVEAVEASQALDDGSVGFSDKPTV
jgi:acylphosphatase